MQKRPSTSQNAPIKKMKNDSEINPSSPLASSHENLNYTNYLNITMVGNIGVGKSSFINTFGKVMRNWDFGMVTVGGNQDIHGNRSTVKFTSCKFPSYGLQFFDTAGHQTFLNDMAHKNTPGWLEYCMEGLKTGTRVTGKLSPQDCDSKNAPHIVLLFAKAEELVHSNMFGLFSSFDETNIRGLNNARSFLMDSYPLLRDVILIVTHCDQIYSFELRQLKDKIYASIPGKHHFFFELWNSRSSTVPQSTTNEMMSFFKFLHALNQSMEKSNLPTDITN